MSLRVTASPDMASKPVPATVQALQAKEMVLQTEIAKFRELQKETQKCTASRQQLDGQLNENRTVKEEMDHLEGDAVVYKLVGPVLVRQELSEARQTVEKRLDYIGKELLPYIHPLKKTALSVVKRGRYDDMIQGLEKKQESVAMKLSALQQDYQQSLVKAGIIR